MGRRFSCQAPRNEREAANGLRIVDCGSGSGLRVEGQGRIGGLVPVLSCRSRWSCLGWAASRRFGRRNSGETLELGESPQRRRPGYRGHDAVVRALYPWEPPSFAGRTGHALSPTMSRLGRVAPIAHVSLRVCVQSLRLNRACSELVLRQGDAPGGRRYWRHGHAACPIAGPSGMLGFARRPSLHSSSCSHRINRAWRVWGTDTCESTPPALRCRVRRQVVI